MKHTSWRILNWWWTLTRTSIACFGFFPFNCASRAKVISKEWSMLTRTSIAWFGFLFFFNCASQAKVVLNEKYSATPRSFVFFRWVVENMGTQLTWVLKVAPRYLLQDRLILPKILATPFCSLRPNKESLFPSETGTWKKNIVLDPIWKGKRMILFWYRLQILH